MAHSSQHSDSERSYNGDDDYGLKPIKMEPETLLTQDDDILSSLDHQSSALDIETNYPDVDSIIGDDNSNEGVLSQHMDIREPLSKLKNLLQIRTNYDISDFKFWLQDSQELEGHKNLVDQCVQGEGLVQVNVEIKYHQKKINIVDVLKPAEDYSEEPENTEPVAPQEHGKSKVLRWMIDTHFKQEQDRLKIPYDPMLWDQTHVKHWIQWAVRQFNLKKIHLSDWNITGAELCALQMTDFHIKAPDDPGDVFWTHLELLKKCKFVAVVQPDPELNENPVENNKKKSHTSNKTKLNTNVNSSTKINSIQHNQMKMNPTQSNQTKINPIQSSQSQVQLPGPYHRPLQPRPPSIYHQPPPPPPTPPHLNGNTSQESSTAESGTSTQTVQLNKTTNTGQIQLWQFLLELLTSKEHRGIILWEGTEGQFRLQRPETVAQLWGKRKNKPSMNYEKLSRALRYYYEGDMISKVSGKRFAYKFDCDLKSILGYSAAELSRLVNGQKRNAISDDDLSE
ncbi:hypothetical protein HCN44_004151 [Aphidius gifuensis]|uniref:DNA-binding protein Ets97D n=1 Tax=Aphidius gifuensis TaxID=684658 RepID=A0A835CS73_APHGI|nr:DNA-binding protein Ets97D [Aphidius gifuensis]KAF7994679.1 hypothetical protein HCN44_004151 [Aphidius gifuensis]